METGTMPPLPEFAQRLALPLDHLRPPLQWREIFGRPGPNAIEIGTGNGSFIVREAGALPHWNFLGVEREHKFYAKMLKRVGRAGRQNVRGVCREAVDLIDTWIPENSVDRLYIFFSDPWPKRRHRSRRLVGPELLPHLERVLKAGADVRFKTDVDFYFNLAVTAFRRRPQWDLIRLGRLGAPDPAGDDVMTNFERKGREAGRRIWGVRAVMQHRPPETIAQPVDLQGVKRHGTD